MKKKNIALLIIGILLIGISILIMFYNSNKKIDLNNPKEKIENLKKEIDELVVTDKIENLKTYQIKISELAIIVNELEGTNYEMYKNKEISLYDYLINNKKLKNYNKEIEKLRNQLTAKLK